MSHLDVPLMSLDSTNSDEKVDFSLSPLPFHILMIVLDASSEGIKSVWIIIYQHSVEVLTRLSHLTLIKRSIYRMHFQPLA